MQIGDDRDGQPVVQVEHACNGLEWSKAVDVAVVDIHELVAV